MSKVSIDELFEKQKEFQKYLVNVDLPINDPEMMSYHILGLVGEIGEVMQADKRWKNNGRNVYYDKNEKLMEIADCFIFMINIVLFSGFEAEDIMSAVKDKINKNIERLL